MLRNFSLVWLCATLWTVARQVPLSMGFSRLEYWIGLPFPSPGKLTDSGIKPMSLMSPALAGGFSTTRATWEAQMSPWVSPIIPGSDNKVPFTWHINHTKASFVSLESSKWTCSVVSDYLWPPWTIAHQGPLYMGFSRQEWVGITLNCR